MPQHRHLGSRFSETLNTPARNQKEYNMSRSTPERDWKYIRSVHDDLLAALCERINKHSADLLASFAGPEHEKYLKLYRHIHDSDRIIALCFNDLKRSNLILKLAALQHHGILTPEHIENLSQETQEKLQAHKQLNEKFGQHAPRQRRGRAPVRDACGKRI